jgi:hypothetical protein
MKNQFILSVVILALISIGCETGPTGANPVSTAVTGTKNNKSVRRGADVMVSGDSIKIITFNFEFDSLLASELRFDLSEFSVFNAPEVTVRFKGGLPKSPGTFAWEPTIVSNLTDITVTAGPYIQVDGTFYFPVSGNTVVTAVETNGSGAVTRITGYFNGKLQAALPKGFLGTFPPGYDITKPTLFGNVITVHSGWFDAKNHTRRSVN